MNDVFYLFFQKQKKPNDRHPTVYTSVHKVCASVHCYCASVNCINMLPAKERETETERERETERESE